MGFTIEDTLTVSRNLYRMELLAGRDGWSNSIKWILMVEDFTILMHFTGKEMAVTTGLGFEDEASLLRLAETLSEKNASALVINTGFYVKEVPESVIRKCDELSLPLLTVPWEVSLSDMIKDLTIRVYTEDMADEQISAALIRAIRNPHDEADYREDLMPYFDVDGDFQVIIISPAGLDTMDTVERRRLSYRLQLYLEDITHNGNFFYYDSHFVLVVNDVAGEDTDLIIGGFLSRTARRMPDRTIYVGIGSRVKDISRLHISFKRALAAERYNMRHQGEAAHFDKMGINRLFYSVGDTALLRELSEDVLKPLIEYDEKNPGSDYVNVLRVYLESNGSVQTAADRLFTHRNTVIYRMNRIRGLLDCDLSLPEDRTRCLIACLIREELYRTR